MPPFEYIQTTLTGEVNGEKLIAKGKVVKAKGWKKLYDREVDDEGEEDIKEQELPKLKEGMNLKFLRLMLKREKQNHQQDLMKELYYLPWKILKNLYQ